MECSIFVLTTASIHFHGAELNLLKDTSKHGYPVVNINK